MCLSIDKELTEKGITGKQVHSNGMVKVWKILRSFNNILVSPVKSYYTWKTEWNKSNRLDQELTYDEKNQLTINYGIHVFLTRKETREWARLEWPRLDGLNYVIVPVYVYKKDLVARNKREAVFTKVFLKKEDYQKAIKKGK